MKVLKKGYRYLAVTVFEFLYMYITVTNPSRQEKYSLALVHVGT